MVLFPDERAMIHAQPPRVEEVTYLEMSDMLKTWASMRRTWRRGGWFRRDNPRPLIVHKWTGYVEDDRYEAMLTKARAEIGKPYRMLSEYFGWGREEATWEEFGESSDWHCSYFGGMILQVPGNLIDFRIWFPRLTRPGRITPAHVFWVLDKGVVSGFENPPERIVYDVP
jgi:hypothetical protein